VGRALPVRVFARREAQAFSLARFPYLADHALKGDPVLPLAAAADLLADALAGATGADAVTIESLELVRGVSASKPGTLEARVDGRTGIDGTTDALLELWHDGALAYRAKGHVGPATPASVALRGAAITPALTLERFYGGVTFHGPRLRGIRAIDAVTQDGIRGEVVGAAAATALMPETTRGRFAIDPVLLDSAFQLAGFWAVSERRRAGYPIGFRRLVARRPTGGAALVATVALVEATDDRFVGDLSLATPSGEVVLTIEGLEGRFADSVSLDAPAAVSGANGSGANGSGAHASGAHASGAHASGAHASGAHASGTNGSGAHAAEAPTLDVPRETFDPAAFPEVEALDQRLQMAELIGLKNPYFTLHLGTARNRSNVNGVEMINFSSYNYLGFSGHPQVVGAAQRAIERYGTSVSASRVASGERPIHRELERAIADHIGVEDSIVLVSGHATNVTTIGTLVGADDIVVHDALAHESILSGIKQSHAARRPFAHQDLDALERTLRAVRGHYRRCLIAVEGIYSMDGDICDLPRLIELKKRYKALLMVDEAHSIGVLGHQGRGVAHHFADVNPNDVDVWMGTLSKSFSSCGGYIAGSKALVRLLKYSAGGFVYSAGITPPNAAAALESIALMRAQPEVVEKLRHNSRFFLDACRARGLDTGLAMGFAVIPVIVGNSLDALKLSAALAKQKINVNPIVYPAVEDDAARLRFFLSSTHTEDELTFTANTVADTLARIRRGEDEETTVAASP
jgi:8-amino-7-oxononanoate synthase